MKLCLLYPANFFQHPKDVSIFFNQQLFYLYSYVRRHAPQIEVQILDLQREITLPQVIDVKSFLLEVELLLRQSGFDVVGISCWTTLNYPSSVEVAKLCKRLNPECTVIVGGYHPTFMAEDFIYPGSPFDYVVKGEGEQALLDIVTGKIPKEAPTQVVQGVSLPMEAHELSWGEVPYHQTLKVMPVWLSRGCPFACAFCADRLTNYRFLSPRAAIAELKQVLATYPKVNYLQFFDPLFGIRKDWRREFLTLLREADLPVRYWAETRADLLEQADVDLLAGLSFRLDMGLESVVPEMLAIMKKTAEPQQYLKRCFELDAAMSRQRVPHVFNHIYNHPGETSRMLMQSLGFWQDYFRQVDRTGGRCVTHVAVSMFMLMPGSEVFSNWPEYVQKYGCSTVDLGWWRQANYPHEARSQYVVASRELAENQQLDLAARTALTLIDLAGSHVDREAFRWHMLPNDWESYFQLLRADQGMAYFADKPLRLHPRAALYPLPDGTTVLVNFANRQSRPLSPVGRARLQALLDGQTVAGLARTMQDQPHAAEEQVALHRFVTDLLAGEYLVLGYPPPEQPAPSGQPRVRLRTSRGDIELELDADRAPLLVANFLYLVQRRYYDGVYFDLQHPSRWVEVGSLAPYTDGPGYTLPVPAVSLPAEPGTISLVRVGAALHGSLIRLHRQAEPAEAAFGRVVAGWDVLNALLIGDYVIGLEPLEPAATGAPAAAEVSR